MRCSTLFLKQRKSISGKCYNYFIIRRHFCEALFKIDDSRSYEYNNFNEAISCADGIDVIQKKLGTIKHINLKKNQQVHSSIYSTAIKRAQELNEYSECWRLYNEAKHESQIDVYLITQMINITSSFVETQFMFDYDNKYSKMYNKSKTEIAKHKMLFRVHQLFNEMRNELNLQPTHATYSSLITACSKFKSFIGAEKYWNLYCNDNNLKTRNIDVYASIIYSKVNKTDINNARKLFYEMINVYHIKPNGYIVSKLLSGYANLIIKRKNNQSKFLEISHLLKQSEEVIKTYLNLNNDKQMIEIEVLNGICNVYASSGDITSCFDILHCLLDKKLPNSFNVNGDKISVPSPNRFTFNTCLKSLVYCDELRSDKNKSNIWRLVDFLLNKMNELNINRDCTTYSTLFNLCGNSNNQHVKPDLDKAIEFYLELANTSTIVSRKCMYSLLMTGLQFYDHCQDNKDDKENKQKSSKSKHEFIEWWMSEAKDHRVQCNLSVEDLVLMQATKFRFPR